MVFWTAISMLIFFSASRAFIKNLVIKTSLFIAPERIREQESGQNLAFLLKIRDLSRENLRLKNILNIKNKARLIPANVIFGGGYLFSDVILINQGENAGIKIGDLVTYGDKILIGRILEVGVYRSKAALLGHLGDKIVLRQDLSENSQAIPIETAGRGAGELQAEIPAEVNLKIGDMFRSAENPEYLVGVIDKITAEASNQFKTITIIAPIAPSLLYEVTVVSKK